MRSQSSEDELATRLAEIFDLSPTTAQTLAMAVANFVADKLAEHERAYDHKPSGNWD